LIAVRNTRISILLTLIALLAMAIALPSAAGAKSKKKKKSVSTTVTTPPLVGIGDNNAPMFSDPKYRALGVKIARRIVPYDYYQDPAQLASLSAWISGAQSAGVDPLISFEHSHIYPTKLPTVAEYAESLNFLRSHFPGVTTISPWNEANHKSQPTVNNPKRAAQYYNYTRATCPECTIIAADVLDQKNLMPWLKKFTKAAKKPKIWGLHSYSDTNGGKSWNKSTTKQFLATVKGQVWLTEVGGIVAFNYKYGYDENRAAAATTRALNLGLKSPRITRIYLYCWFGVLNPGQGSFPYVWDSGIVSPGGQPRAGYHALQAWMGAHPRT
jgi:hypothetical protein